MPTTLHELFQPEAMGALVVRYADQSENRNFLKVYEEGERITANADGTFSYEEQRFSRDLAPIMGQDSPSKSAKKLKVTKKAGTCLAIKEHVDLPARYLEAFNTPGMSVPDAPTTIARNLQNLTNKVMSTLNYWAAKSMLTQTGVVSFSAFPNTDLAAGSETYPVKAIDASAAWSTAGTKIRSDEINDMRKAYTQAAGFKPRRVIASNAIEQYITANTEIANFIQGHTLAGQILARSFEEGGSAIPFGGLSWEFVEDYYALDSAEDTPVDLFADLDVFALLPGPERSQECFGMVEGLQFVPTGPVAGQVVGSPGNLFRPQRGFGAYVELTTAPVGLRLHVFWTGYLVQKMPNAVGVMDTSP